MTSSQDRPHFFYTAPPGACPYLPNRIERKILVDLATPDANFLHSRLSHAGFRRSHTLAYAPICDGCSACIPIRLPVRNLTPHRTQKRVVRRNADLMRSLLPPTATDEQYTLFRRYLDSRHSDGEMAGMSMHDYRIMVEETPVDTRLVEFRTPDATLMAASLIDVLEDGLSAVYSFYEPNCPQRSLGSFAILSLAELAMQMELPYLYLGYWVPGSPKMAYKERFQPAEILRNGTWQKLDLNYPPKTERAHPFPEGPLF
ncbi:arginyltransferase [Acetobacter sp. DmW_136]|uniref:arginyltransferase n=1 Tax=Acetobacter sp. DmW_136 TaxID=2591091 RepID=UPI0012384FC2|nr:arginyltransferase [Acetobacter sp. DmW_136]KAA8383425.1 arginyltransferase [Acetobacter sp. DmW_136]